MVNTRSSAVLEDNADRVEEATVQVGQGPEGTALEAPVHGRIEETEAQAPEAKPDIYELHKMVKEIYESLSFRCQWFEVTTPGDRRNAVGAVPPCDQALRRGNAGLPEEASQLGLGE